MRARAYGLRFGSIPGFDVVQGSWSWVPLMLNQGPDKGPVPSAHRRTLEYKSCMTLPAPLNAWALFRGFERLLCVLLGCRHIPRTEYTLGNAGCLYHQQ